MRGRAWVVVALLVILWAVGLAQWNVPELDTIQPNRDQTPMMLSDVLATMEVECQTTNP